MQGLTDKIKIKNGYSNSDDRASFSIEVMKCTHGSCKGAIPIVKILKELFFTLYYLEENIEFGSDNLGEIPTHVGDTFHSQFQLKTGYYRDNNNFLKINNVETKDERYHTYKDPLKYKYLNLDINPVWVSDVVSQRLESQTRDGTNYRNE